MDAPQTGAHPVIVITFRNGLLASGNASMFRRYRPPVIFRFSPLRKSVGHVDDDFDVVRVLG